MTPSLLRETLSICPSCARTLDARIVERSGAVYMEKKCPDHGSCITYLWPDAQHYRWLEGFRAPLVSPLAATGAGRACPAGCGLCASHLRRATLVELEVTRRCDLRCPVCFVAAGEPLAEPDLETLQSMFTAALAQAGAETSIQLTGGEPTVRDDLQRIVRSARALGFHAVEINTNGLRIASEPGYLESLRSSGISGVYLQFDGLNDAAYEALRGHALLQEKLAAVARCRQAGVQVVLAMTVVRGVNEDQLGSVLAFALENRDVVAGVAYQPAFTSGRFEPEAAVSIGLGDVVLGLAEQSYGLIGPRDLWPLTTSHPLCSVGTLLLRSKNTFESATRFITMEDFVEGCDAASPQGSVFSDLLARKGVDVSDGLSVVVMNYMDATNLDLERLRECSMVVTMEDGRLVPFCAYQLTTASGDRQHVAWGRNEQPPSSTVPELASELAGLAPVAQD